MGIVDTVDQLRHGDKRIIGLVMSEVENGDSRRTLERLYAFSGRAFQIGITGPPGAGKSTLVNALAEKLLRDNKKVGIIAVDPTSPFSGGALLGDRVRMTALGQDPHVFIRSMASRGSLGGLARKTKDVALVLDAAGMDYVVIETIGVGQVELDIAQVCDTTIVVLVPESGDSIQALKAGLLEIADIIAVNKGDRDGSDQLVMELKFAFDLKPKKIQWQCPIIKTVATEDAGVADLLTAIIQHRDYLRRTGEFEKRRKARITAQINDLIHERIKDHLEKNVINDNELSKIVDAIYQRKTNPYQIADRIAMKIIRPGYRGGSA
jgi:LAO/AO transport system kinase